jgi:uncharacterized protein YecT (DUF1311 family)
MHYFARLVIGLCGALLSFHLGFGSAQARRVALVIGNADYRVGPLGNPVNDAIAVAEALGKPLRFDKVILKRNLGFDGFRAALIEMGREAVGADLGVIFYAGHGIEVGGRNFLIPVDATLAKASALDLEAISMETVLSQLDGVRGLRLVILDACRNNPFSVAGAKRTVSRGLHRVEPGDNTLVAFAAKDGTTADDGPGRRHSPFTEALLTHIATPGVEIRFLFAHVRDDVMKMTNREQQPYVYGTLGSRQIFLHPHGGPALKPPAGPGARPSGESAEMAKEKAAVEASKARAEAEIAKADAERHKARTEIERARAEAERAAAELAKARAEAALARAEAEHARLKADKQRQVFLPPPSRIHDPTALFNPAAVPSFNCSKYATTPPGSPHRNPQTHVLCIEPQAASVDFELGKVYQDSLRGLSAAARRGAVARQRRWILDRNGRCPASWDDLGVPGRRQQIAECLIRETYARMHELRR